MPTLVADASSNERKKRTRPVSACENCRSKKVKCHLLPDRPVCKGCAQSGKECLFRIDDLSPALRRERFAEYGEPDEDDDAATQQPARRRRKRSSFAGVEANDDEGNSSESAAKPKPVFRSFANPTKLAAPSASTARSAFRSESGSTERSNETGEERANNQHGYRGPSQDTHEQSYTTYNNVASSSSLSVNPRQDYMNGHNPSPHNLNGQHGIPTPFDVRPHHDVYHASVQPYVNTPQAIWPHRSHDGHAQGQYDHGRPHPSTSPTRPYYERDNGGYANSAVRQQLPYPTPSALEPHAPLPSVQSRDFAARPALPSWSSSAIASSPRSTHALISGAASQHYVPAPQPSVSSGPLHPYASKRHPSFGSSGGSTRPTEFPTHGSDGAAAINTVRSNPSVEDDHHGIERNDLAAASKLEEEHESAVAKQKNVSFGRKSTYKTSQNGHSATHASLSDPTNSPRSSSNSSKPPATFKKIALPFFRWFGATANTPGIRRIKVGVYHDQDMDMIGDEGATPALSTIGLPGTSEDDTRGGGMAKASSIASHAGNVVVSPVPEKRTDSSATKASPLKAPFSPETLTSPAFHGPPTGPSMAAMGAESVLSTSARELFESSRPRYPRKDLLLHLSEIFVKYFKASCFPWIDEVELMASAESGELPAISANAICAVAARFSGHADLARAKNPSEAFADMAKVLIVPMLSWPSIEVIEALIILSYAEFGAGADAGLWMYIGMALRMATDLGLQHELTIQSMATKKQQERARFMFWAIVCLDRITCFGTGRPLTIRDDTYDCQLPPLEQDSNSDGFVFGYIVRTLLKRGRIGELLNRREDDLAFEQRGAQLRAFWLDLANYYETLPSDLHFGVNTFRKMAAADQGSAFVYLHVLLQSTISLLNRPSLLRRFDKDFMVTAPSSLAGIANHASGTIVSILRFAVDAGNHRARTNEEHPDVNPYLDCNPYLDQLILPAGRAFLSERESAKETLRSFGHQGPLSRPVTRDGQDKATVKPFGASSGLPSNDELFRGINTRRQYAQTNIESCQEVLDRIARWWNGAQWPARALRQEALGDTEEDQGPDGPDEEAQPAPIRDVEMVLRWARARRIRARRATPDESRRNSDASATDAKAGTAHDHAAGETAGGYANGTSGGGVDGHNEDGAKPYDLSSFWHDANGTDASPLGLGFSGSLGAAAEIDVDALINAWAKELGTVGSTSAIHGDIGTPGSTTLGPRGTTSYYYDNGREAMTPGALASRSRPASRPHSRAAVNRKRAPSTPGGMSDIFTSHTATTGNAMSATTPNASQQQHFSGSVYDMAGWPLGVGQNGMNIDLSAMHMEEFFYDSDPVVNMTGPSATHEQPSTAANGQNDHHMDAGHAQHGLYVHDNSRAALHDQRGISAFPGPKEEAYGAQMVGTSGGGGTILHPNLDMLPAALLNTLNLHPGHTHLHTGQAPQPG